jgi:hypothetical protein
VARTVGRRQGFSPIILAPDSWLGYEAQDFPDPIKRARAAIAAAGGADMGLPGIAMDCFKFLYSIRKALTQPWARALKDRKSDKRRQRWAD